MRIRAAVRRSCWKWREQSSTTAGDPAPVLFALSPSYFLISKSKLPPERFTLLTWFLSFSANHIATLPWLTVFFIIGPWSGKDLITRKSPLRVHWAWPTCLHTHAYTPPPPCFPPLYRICKRTRCDATMPYCLFTTAAKDYLWIHKTVWIFNEQTQARWSAVAHSNYCSFASVSKPNYCSF